MKLIGPMHNLMVTGGCGFVGSNFIRYLLTEADFEGRIVNIDKLTYAGNRENLAGLVEVVGDRYHFEQVDICDAAEIERVFDEYEIDSVAHFAAESHVDRSITGPAAFIQTNIIGTYTLLEAARARLGNFELFHHVSTDEVFGTLGDTGAFTETTPYNPSSPYSASKASSDHLVRAYSKTYGLPVTISNCSNNYGPYQFPEKLIPLMILNAVENKQLPVYGEGLNVRDWLFVRDHAVAIWNIMRQGRRGETYNIGGDCEMTNLAVVETVCDIVDELCPGKSKEADEEEDIQKGRLDSRRELIRFVADRLGHDWRYAIDFSKLKNELGWEPTEPFEAGLRKTVQWHLDNLCWVEKVRG